MKKIPVILFFRNFLVCSGVEQLLRKEIGMSNISKYISFDEIDESSKSFAESLIVKWFVQIGLAVFGFGFGDFNV